MKRIISILVVFVVALSLGGCVSQQQQQNDKAAYNALPAEFRSEVKECDREYRQNSIPGSAEREAECLHEAQGQVAERKHVPAMPMSKEAREAVEAEHPALAKAEQKQHTAEGKEHQTNSPTPETEQQQLQKVQQWNAAHPISAAKLAKLNAECGAAGYDRERDECR
jgi:hypothetical protein